MKDRIFVIDGSSYLYRAFHAMPPLSTSTGIPTGAIKGVTNMLMTLKKDSEGSPIIVVFDAKGKTFRNDIFSSYKANRPPMPDDLRSQIEPVKLICKAIGFPLLIIDGVEADDVIATVAEKAKNRNLKCVISSLDKDLMQLVEDPKVSMMNTMTHQIFDEEKVLDKFGVKPTQIRDLLALTGDSSDNIPGIPKVGQKTAAKWLNEFENIKNIKSNADSIKGVVGDNLRGFITDLDRNIELVSLKRDVDLKVKFEDLLIANPNEDELERIFKELEFTNPNSVKEAPATKKDNKYETVLTEKELNNWILKINECNSFAIDTETDSVQTVSANLLGISLSVSENEGCYIPLGHQYDDCPKQLEMDYVIKSLGSAIEDNQEKAIGQNLKFDIPILARHGIKITKFLADTMLMSYVLNSTATRHGMDRLADFYLNYKTTKYTDVTGTASKQISFAEVKLDVATDYAAEDADITLRLYKVLNKLLKEKPTQQKLLNDLEYPLVHVLSRVEQNGAKIDKKKLSNHSKELSEKISDLTSQAFKISGEEFNLDSPKQLLEILYEKQGLPVLKKTPKGQPSTNEDTLQRLSEDYELPKIILQYRTLAKLKSTYTDSLINIENPKTKRIHTSYQQAITSTGRLSSTEPNLQNIPIKTAEGRRIREAFVPENGNVLISADYSQIELRIMAHLSEDKNLTHSFNNNIDVHSSTAAEVFGVSIDDVSPDQRRSAKAINFGLMYGMSAFGLTRQLGIPRGEAQEYLDTYFARYTGVRDYMDNIKAQAKEDKYVETIMGRRLYLNEINAANGLRRQAAERAAINAPLQGSAADIIKKAMLDIDELLLNELQDVQMIMQVHDELVFECPKNKADAVMKKMKDTMEDTVELKIPLIADAAIGLNWNEAH
ncbi:MAG: DNA polymerase I [Gammaproteobacteria bacterium TMED278]|jgi:DNA polymerase-1|nr:DNA polymerase I [Gammaproteobacteria bacterium]OUX41495.1 MAG: DNA polymerase I [Gammaproteobacteria bacterium TMED278]RCL36217.1 MAG: DNA polymerase I [SAR86 cluster bacterium]URQ69606.1 DNA polymerase I [SAR86 cluster bacterium]|tara:strand:- start:2 stop:2674 length:2673 start_codon:yes stop_codon:yes gene_type:complete